MLFTSFEKQGTRRLRHRVVADDVIPFSKRYINLYLAKTDQRRVKIKSRIPCELETKTRLDDRPATPSRRQPTWY